MNIEVTKPAVKWFKEEFNESEHKHIRFFARYGGCGSFQSGFSLGISQEEPENPLAKIEVDNFIFFVEEKDAWYFGQHDLKVKYSRTHDEIEFESQEVTR
ncbi:HesB/YadR/YfhF family protein [Alkalicoccobacillus plakortidis]|uniref:HesB/YadR/YfhF family protein n=1 Tax=Alkalicoccobacillus plakortidis TaxID=444060 RepID=A0ABT0XFZ7_9BACI|nr:HesB/YadR/YfhF family protein [Alkalicoccobacillus plakortidis]MCM2674620.1 HesB/YadR/YfhF family protein [Alkalicoccobacillus plakortidis]